MASEKDVFVLSDLSVFFSRHNIKTQFLGDQIHLPVAVQEVKQLQKHADTALHLSMEYRTAVEVLLPEVWHGQRVKKGEDVMKRL